MRMTVEFTDGKSEVMEDVTPYFDFADNTVVGINKEADIVTEDIALHVVKRVIWENES